MNNSDPPTFIVETRGAQDTRQHPESWKEAWRGPSIEDARNVARHWRAQQWTDVQIRVEFF